MSDSGPARRNDKNILKMHLEMLDDKNTMSLYKTISDMIKDKYEINYKEKLNDINAFIFDVDGVLTDGSLIISESESY